LREKLYSSGSSTEEQKQKDQARAENLLNQKVDHALTTDTLVKSVSVQIEGGSRSHESNTNAENNTRNGVMGRLE